MSVIHTLVLSLPYMKLSSTLFPKIAEQFLKGFVVKTSKRGEKSGTGLPVVLVPSPT